jgi:hypothetical protein
VTTAGSELSGGRPRARSTSATRHRELAPRRGGRGLPREEAVEVAEDLPHVLRAASGVLLEHAGDDLEEAGGERALRRRRRRVPGEDRLDELDRVAPLERPSAREHLVEQDAEGEDVAARVDRVAPGLLGRHVGERPHDRALEGAVAPAPRGGVRVPRRREAGEAEVEHLHETALGQHDVAGLDVPVDDAVLVRVGEGLRHLPRNGHQGRRLQAPALEHLGERPAPHVLHRDVGDIRPVALPFPHVVDDGHVGMVEGRGDPGLAQETSGRLGVTRVLAGQHLQGDEAVQARVLGQPDLAHRAGAERLPEDVVRDRLRGHGSPHYGAAPGGASARGGQAQGRVEFANATRRFSRW